ncbi:MAG: 4-(cytidine 5'-diphospho)-2-C-methyl-D-erythritol kinase [Planctomycetota bacterium]|jgi:4-diphosphocytidyl-2-C-methyl-D-erythritol kinase
MTRRVVRDAPAKLNLFLEVLFRRPDGYHELDSVFSAVDLHDTVEIEKSSKIILEVEGSDVPADESNLAWRAARALGLGARIVLRKRIPAGAGLGGGSSDAAAVLLGLHELYERPVQMPALTRIARDLGADVPLFLHGGLARCRGVGERVEPLKSPGPRQFLLVCPAIHSATKGIFQALEAGLPENPRAATIFLERYLGTVPGAEAPYFNRLQAVAERVTPLLRMIREDAESRFGKRFTLTGSGSSYFAEFGTDLRNPTPAWSVENVAVQGVLVRSA